MLHPCTSQPQPSATTHPPTPSVSPHDLVRSDSGRRCRREPSPSHTDSTSSWIGQLVESAGAEVDVCGFASDACTNCQCLYELYESWRILHRSTTLRSTLRFPFTCGLNRVARILRPQSGLAFGFEPLDAASKRIWLTAQMSSLSEEVMPQAPRAGE